MNSKMDFSISTPNLLANFRLPKDKILKSLGFMFTNFGELNQTQVICKFGDAMAANRQSRVPIDNKASLLLTSDENETVFSLLGKRCFTLATAVVQLLVTEPPHHVKWTVSCTGVACFVKDNPKRSYFIRVYDFDVSGQIQEMLANRRKMVWQQELYNTFEYKTPRVFFHTFEADDCMAGLNFANETEAISFKNAINEKLNIRQQKRQERRRQQTTGLAQPTQTGVSLQVPAANRSQSLNSLALNNKKAKNKKGKLTRPKLTKEDIGTPTNFVHVQHIGWDPNTGFDLDNVNPTFRQFLERAGVSQEHLQDRETRTFIYDFIDKHGGIDAAIEEVERPPPVVPSMPPVAAPPLPTTAPPLPPSRDHSRVPSHHGHKAAAPQPPGPPPGIPPPPPPPIAAPPVAPPPPPPMPMAMATNGSPALPLAPPMPTITDSRSALMDQIRKGTQLHHVEPDKDSVKSNSSNGDPRNALMNQIRQGVNLKTVETNAGKADKTTNVAEAGGLAGALARALHERSRAIRQTESDSSSGSDDEEDEWDD